MSIIATRIQKFIKKLIKLDQTGFISGCQGTNNMRRALNLQSIEARDGQPLMLLRLDAEKVFNRVDYFGGHCSDFSKVERGVRQGDSLSPILFVLSIEPLAEAICQNIQIQGI